VFQFGDFSEKILSNVSADFAAKLKSAPHLLVLISRVSLPRSWKNW
jgi:hypothetical protein